MLRYKEDRRVGLWMLVTSGLLIFNWMQPTLNILVLVASCLMAVAVTTITHNHNHQRIWQYRWLNVFQDYWLTLFYEFPIFGWIPTHNQNHHKFINREGDYTITYRMSEKNNLWTLLSYPTVSSFWQQRLIGVFLARVWRTRRPQFWYCMTPYLILGLWIGAVVWLDWRKALLYVVLPQQVGLFSVLGFNYL